jgi:hypothetical protein
MTDITIIKVATPMVMPRKEKIAITEIKPSDLLDFLYKEPKENPIPKTAIAKRNRMVGVNFIGITEAIYPLLYIVFTLITYLSSSF